MRIPTKREQWMRVFLACLLCLAATDVSGAQAPARQDSTGSAQKTRSGTWSAKSSTGREFAGTWTANPDSTGAVTGTWTLMDASGKTLAGGGWSAAKSPTQWYGAWRALVTGRDGEYSGTWTSSVDLKGDAQLVDLVEKAAEAVVSGNWRYGANSGAWAIRARK